MQSAAATIVSASPLAGARAPRAQVRCLVVHDDLELRLRLASLVRRAIPTLDADGIGGAAFDALPAERVEQYAALLLVVEFQLRDATDPLARLGRARSQSPQLPIFVFARGGDERNAALTIKRGADDYWPVHSVKVGELVAALQPLVQPPEAAPPPPPAPAEPAAPVEVSRQPRFAGYDLMKTLGQSGDAAVYLAHAQDLVQSVALKVRSLKGSPAIAEADRERFARDCEVRAALNHPAISDVLDFGVTNAHLYLAQEYFPCGSLRERLQQPLCEADAVAYARQIAEALQVAHEAGLVHRDLKPSNLMVTDDEQLILVDFASPRLPLGDLSAGYAAPELWRGLDVDARADVYSLGVMLYEMLVGAPPHAGATPAEVAEAHAHLPVPRLPQRVLRYQPLLERMLAKNPADRYPSAAEFLDDLTAVSAPLRTSVA